MLALSLGHERHTVIPVPKDPSWEQEQWETKATFCILMVMLLSLVVIHLVLLMTLRAKHLCTSTFWSSTWNRHLCLSLGIWRWTHHWRNQAILLTGYHQFCANICIWHDWWRQCCAIRDCPCSWSRCYIRQSYSKASGYLSDEREQCSQSVVGSRHCYRMWQSCEWKVQPASMRADADFCGDYTCKSRSSYAWIRNSTGNMSNLIAYSRLTCFLAGWVFLGRSCKVFDRNEYHSLPPYQGMEKAKSCSTEFHQGPGLYNTTMFTFIWDWWWIRRYYIIYWGCMVDCMLMHHYRSWTSNRGSSCGCIICSIIPISVSW